MSKIEKMVFDMAEPFAKEIGCEVIETEYKKEGSDYYLRIYIDKESGSIGTDDCEYVSRKVEIELDREDPIKDSYILEVCSPGIDRELKREKDFVRFMGNDVDIKFYAPRDGKKEYCGKLIAYDNGKVLVECENKKVISFNKNDVVYIKLAVKF